MDAQRFDRWTRGLEVRLSRRSLSAIGAGALAALGFAAQSDAKKKKGKKKRKKGGPTRSYGCRNIGFPCGKTGICVCRLTKSSQQICSNGVVPPNGISFQICQSSANCPSNQVCDLLNSICVNKCQTN